ncbi:integrase [Paraburkholderia sediminicola]|uniref:Integrase n=1 Tax=Paraburkholderia rhynchosiae TaxID=487049 RepID=A0ACC7NFI2_9BURK
MDKVVTFVPRADLDAQQNLDGFIDVCRNHLTIFGATLDFESDTWETNIEIKGKYSELRLVFSNLETCDSRRPAMMREPFRSFAKAYMRYQHAMRPTKAVSGRVAALRLIEAALCETDTVNPVAIDTDILNRAAQMAQARFDSPDTAYRAGQQIEMVADFSRDNRLTATLVSWKNPINRPAESGKKVGKEADDIRLSKLPTPAALDALPKAFRLAIDPADVLVTSLTALLVCAPDRINESLLLRENCERTELDQKHNKERYGLEWYPAKGAEPMIKWIVPSMVDVAKEALGRIRTLTNEARQVAKWYEANPSKIYLANKELEALRNKEWLTTREVADILFADAVSMNSPREWCEANDVPLHRQGPKRLFVRFADLESAVLKMLPPGFPVVNEATGLKYSEALCVMLRNTLDAKKAVFRCVIEPIGHPHIHNRLGARSTTGIQSIFDKCGLFEEDGSPIRVHSHQFRNYLNTLAQMGGMSQLDIAKWSGRKDIRQNEAYDHESTQSLLARVRSIVGDDARMFGPVTTTSQSILIPRDEFGRLKIPTAHTTDYGYCVHDYVMSPCQIHRDCLNCNEQFCVKGEAEKEKRLRQAHAEAIKLASDAEQAVADGDYGAEEWLKTHRNTLATIEALLAIIDNPAVPVGSVILPVRAEQASRLDFADEARAALTESPAPRLSETTTESEEVTE